MPSLRRAVYQSTWDMAIGSKSNGVADLGWNAALANAQAAPQASPATLLLCSLLGSRECGSLSSRAFGSGGCPGELDNLLGHPLLLLPRKLRKHG
jgi:hypothetical protein